MNNKKGISLISLIITIIVIIILAAIVIFNGFGATESAQFAKFSQEFSNYQEEIQQKFLSEKTKNSIRGEIKSDSEIYAEITGSTGESLEELIDDEKVLGRFAGETCFLLSDAKVLYQEQDGVYVTDKGELFTLPGFKYNTNGEERKYVNAGEYYASEEMTPNGGNTPLLAVGTIVNYSQKDSTYQGQWVYLGKEGGKNLIMSTTSIGIISYHYTSPADWWETNENVIKAKLGCTGTEPRFRGEDNEINPGYMAAAGLMEKYFMEYEDGAAFEKVMPSTYANAQEAINAGITARSVTLEDLIKPDDDAGNYLDLHNKYLYEEGEWPGTVSSEEIREELVEVSYDRSCYTLLASPYAMGGGSLWVTYSFFPAFDYDNACFSFGVRAVVSLPASFPLEELVTD